MQDKVEDHLEMDLVLARQGDYPGASGVKRMAAEIASLREERDALREALAWAMQQGRLSYSRRIPGQNEHFCDRVDAINALLKDRNAKS